MEKIGHGWQISQAELNQLKADGSGTLRNVSLLDDQRGSRADVYCKEDLDDIVVVEIVEIRKLRPSQGSTLANEFADIDVRVVGAAKAE